MGEIQNVICLAGNRRLMSAQGIEGGALLQLGEAMAVPYHSYFPALFLQPPYFLFLILREYFGNYPVYAHLLSDRFRSLGIVPGKHDNLHSQAG